MTTSATSDRPASELMLLGSTDDMLDFLTSAFRGSGRSISRVRCAVFNGGSSVVDTLSRLRPALGDAFAMDLLVWNNRSADLPADSDIDRPLAAELARLDRYLRAHDVYDARYGDMSELSCEYLMLASRILSRPGYHRAQLTELRVALGLHMARMVEDKKARLEVWQSPIYMPGRILIVDDLAFISLYLHDQQVGPIVMAPRGTLLYDRLTRHFDEVLAHPATRAFPWRGRTADSTPATVATAAWPDIFISYRRQDMRWVAGRLYDLLIGEVGRENVFLDTHKLQPGRPYPKQLLDHLDHCRLLIAVVGPGWFAEKRLSDPKDWVRREVETALDRGIALLPVLVDGAAMPDEKTKLPKKLKALTTIQALPLHFASHPTDGKRILAYVRETLVATDGAMKP